ncbi:hypothetical protein ACO2Q8_23855 [Larkinella sp. VNQ87]|uniref:hypothetical protein n=1 Tax=Larkinella sp. VNQ87 TaxID=3400921 RepID=UPI003C10827B
MKKGKDFSVDFPNQIRFMQLEADNRETELQLEILNLDFQAQQRQYAEKVLELAELRHQLRKEVERTAINEDEEGGRREAIAKLSKQIDGFVMPSSPDRKRFETQKAILKMKLLENNRLNVNLLIGQAIAWKN